MAYSDRTWTEPVQGAGQISIHDNMWEVFTLQLKLYLYLYLFFGIRLVPLPVPVQVPFKFCLNSIINAPKHTKLVAVEMCLVTSRVRSNVFSLTVRHLYPIILPLVSCPFLGYPSDWSQALSEGYPMVGYPLPVMEYPPARDGVPPCPGMGYPSPLPPRIGQ